jgi:hypothetical protein
MNHHFKIGINKNYQIFSLHAESKIKIVKNLISCSYHTLNRMADNSIPEQNYVKRRYLKPLNRKRRIPLLITVIIGQPLRNMIRVTLCAPLVILVLRFQSMFPTFRRCLSNFYNFSCYRFFWKLLWLLKYVFLKYPTIFDLLPSLKYF